MAKLQDNEIFDNPFVDNLENYEKNNEMESTSDSEINSKVEEKQLKNFINENEIKNDLKKLINLKKIFYRNYRHEKKNLN